MVWDQTPSPQGVPSPYWLSAHWEPALPWALRRHHPAHSLLAAAMGGYGGECPILQRRELRHLETKNLLKKMQLLVVFLCNPRGIDRVKH